MIALFTDFGLEGPYIGQMTAILYRDAPGIPVVNLFADAPVHDPRASAYLLAAYRDDFQPDTVFLCVVDPGVGGPRRPVVVRADGQWFVGPDNGLFNVVAMRARTLQWWDVSWRPPRLSATFHGRDLFAPLAARLARGESVPGESCDAAARIDQRWPQDYARVIYFDHFGNAMTGIRAVTADDRRRLVVGGHVLERARTYSEVPAGRGFWYENANGLIEIAVSQGSARERLGLAPGDPVVWQ